MLKLGKGDLPVNYAMLKLGRKGDLLLNYAMLKLGRKGDLPLNYAMLKWVGRETYY
jgi:hypothetical protein